MGNYKQTTGKGNNSSENSYYNYLDQNFKLTKLTFNAINTSRF